MYKFNRIKQEIDKHGFECLIHTVKTKKQTLALVWHCESCNKLVSKKIQINEKCNFTPMIGSIKDVKNDVERDCLPF